MAKKPNPTKTTIKKVTPKKQRVIEQESYKTLRLHKRVKADSKPLPSAFRIMKANLRHIYKQKRVFVGICIVYLLLSLVLITGLLGTSNFSEIKNSLHDVFSGNYQQLTTGVALFGILLSGSGGSISESGRIYQTMMVVLISLVAIWTFRQTYAKEKVKVKEAFYKSTYPLIPFLLVIVVIGIQLIPMVAGTTVFGIVISQGLAVSALEKFLWSILMLWTVLLTLYMVTSSIFALYIVTLPDVTPMQALRSARDIVLNRRWMIMRKLLFLPLCLLLIAAAIMIPILLYATSFAQVTFIFFGMLGLIVTHGYIYKLYRELL
jgi:hypothetical protein